MGACFAVYKEKGCGFLEAVYQECLEIELGLQEIPFQPHVNLQLTYKGRILRHPRRLGRHAFDVTFQRDVSIRFLKERL